MTKQKMEKANVRLEKWITVARRTKRRSVAEAREIANQNKDVFEDHCLETIQWTKSEV